MAKPNIEPWRISPALMARHLTGGLFQIPKHIALLDRIVVEAACTPNRRVIVSMPPRHGKTELVSRWSPVWYLSTFPERNFGIASYGAELAADFGRFARDRVREHSPLLGIDVDPSSSAMDRWEIIRREDNRIVRPGGKLFAVGVGGPLTGRGVHLLSIDDPVKGAAEAFSQAVRDSVWNWFQSDASTRVEPGGSIILTTTRWHDDDLAGRLLKRSREEGGEQWTEIRIPALCESEEDPLGRKIGEALWPERYDREWLEHLRRNKDLWVWAALYQQRPITDVEGVGLTESDIQHYATPPNPSDGEYVQTWDVAFADPTHRPLKGDPKRSKTAGQVWLIQGGKAFLIDRVCRHMSFEEQEKAILEMHARFPRTRRTYVEEAANGYAIISRLSTQVRGIIPVRPKGSKFLRFSAVTPYFRAGNVLLPPESRVSWVREYKQTLLAFPNVDFDDDVDATSQVLSQEFLPEEIGETSATQHAEMWLKLVAQDSTSQERDLIERLSRARVIGAPN